MIMMHKTVDFYDIPLGVNYIETRDGELFIDFNTIQAVLDILRVKVEDNGEAFEILRTGAVLPDLCRRAYKSTFDSYRVLDPCED